MKPTGATKEWTLSKPLTNQIISDDFRRGLTGSISIYGIDVPEDNGDRIHFAGVVVFGDEQRARDIIAAINERERLRELLKATVHAMRSYQHGNSSPDLADEIQLAVNAALNEVEG